MQRSTPDPREARHNRLVSLECGLGVQGEGWRLDEGAHTSIKLRSKGEEHHRKNITPLLQ